jgi:hypothetical protein
MDSPRNSLRSAVPRFGPFVVVAIAVGFGLFVLRAETSVVAYLNDEAYHLGMVEFATTLLKMGRDPLSSWYSLLNLGSPNFLHYQSLPSIVTGAIGIVTGDARTFAWSKYLLLGTWPISMYFGSRLLGWSRWTAAAVACASPLIIDAAGVGYGYGSYVWIGWGVWTQLWAMWTLPLAVGFSWQAITKRRHLIGAVVFTGLTIALHYMTAYPAAFAIVVFGLFSSWGKPFRQRLGRAALLGVLALGAAAWVMVPVVTQGNFAARNEFLQHTVEADSFGARRILSWLVTGQLLDKGRLPVLTVLLAIGLISCLLRFKSDERYRILLVLWVVYLVAFFGRPTLGPLINIVPGNKDLFLRRFVCGFDFSSLLVIGVGAIELARLGARLAARRAPRLDAAVVTACAVVVGLAVLAPAWTEVESYTALNSKDVSYQVAADASQGPEVASLLRVAQALGGGRVYAGLLTNWGKNFLVGYVPVYEYLADSEVDSVGFTLRTASLMSDAEPYFDDTNPGDYALLGVRYLLLPTGMNPPVPADLLLTSGPYALWTLPNVHYVQVVDTVGSIAETRTDIGATSSSFLQSAAPGQDRYLTVAYAGAAAAPPTLPASDTPAGSAGTLVSERVDLAQGTVTATVDATRTAVVLLSASYDPGWKVTVDGVPAATEIVVPALPGVRVPPGRHVVRFTYVGYQNYLELFLVSGVSIVVAGGISVAWKRRPEVEEAADAAREPEESSPPGAELPEAPVPEPTEPEVAVPVETSEPLLVDEDSSALGNSAASLSLVPEHQEAQPEAALSASLPAGKRAHRRRRHGRS